MEMEMQTTVADMLIGWGVPWWGVATLAIATCGLVAGQATTVIKACLDVVPRIHAARAKGDPRWWQALFRGIPLLIGMVAGPLVWPYGWAWAIGLAGGTIAPTVVWLVKEAGKRAAQKAIARIETTGEGAP